ncbi:MAG: hypothetical protein J6575_05575 [Bifidobacterium sp.]|nr:hypothetical protein [Bifidobacterium sp.]
MPLDAVDTTLYVVWKPLPVPSVTDVVPEAGVSGLTESLKVSGTVPVGDGWASVEAVDKVEVSPERASGSGFAAVPTVQGTIDTAGCTATSCAWSASVPASLFAADDLAGPGLGYAFKAKLTTASDGDSAVSATYPTRTVDVVAPVPANLAFDKSARTVSGTVYGSADATHRVGETNFTVKVTWPGSSSPASTTLTCAAGVASPAGATCPTGSDGAFSIPIPSGVLLAGDAQIETADAPAADTITSTGVGSEHPNVSAVATLDVTMPVVSALPMTGESWRSKFDRYLPLALATLAAALVTAAVSRLRRRNAISLR